ncbi:MAG: phosphotransferase [Sphingobium sp.]
MSANAGQRARPVDATPMLAMEGIADLDKAVLSRILIEGGHATGPIEEVTLKPIGVGLLGGSYRLQLRYAAGASGLPALVVKMHVDNPRSRKLARYGVRVEGVYGFYANETAFYQQLAPSLSIRVPDCYAAAVSEDGSRFVLLLEAIEPATPGNDLTPCSMQRLEMAVINIAGLHGPSWDIAADRVDPMIFDSRGPNAATMQSHVQTACKINAERWADYFDAEEFAAFSRFADRYDEWQRAEGRPRSIVHVDHRLDNLLFFDDRDEVVVVDWQTLQLSFPLRDVGQLFAASIDTELRREAEIPMLRVYQEALARHGVTDYGFDRLLDDYRYSLLQGLHGGLLGMATIPLEGRGKELFLTKVRRTMVALRDHRDHMEIDVLSA